MVKQLRVSIPVELHSWLDVMAEKTEIRDYSRLTAYLLQRAKDQAVFGNTTQQSINSSVVAMPNATNADILIEADW